MVCVHAYPPQPHMHSVPPPYVNNTQPVSFLIWSPCYFARRRNREVPHYAVFYILALLHPFYVQIFYSASHSRTPRGNYVLPLRGRPRFSPMQNKAQNYSFDCFNPYVCTRRQQTGKQKINDSMEFNLLSNSTWMQWFVSAIPKYLNLPYFQKSAYLYAAISFCVLFFRRETCAEYSPHFLLATATLQPEPTQHNSLDRLHISKNQKHCCSCHRLHWNRYDWNVISPDCPAFQCSRWHRQ